ncbi:MAG: GxxExxY protein [Planctomycetes bacterium]|nr:GxxExxY protein [Planctomycetota bacterium]
MEHDELTRPIIGCAYRVYNALGSGFLESVYEKCMLIELRKLGLFVENQFPIRVHSDGEVVGNFEADLFVEKTVIVELNAVSALLRVHEVQLVNYVKATGVDVGLLLNFGDQKVEVRRKLRVLPDTDPAD